MSFVFRLEASLARECVCMASDVVVVLLDHSGCVMSPLHCQAQFDVMLDVPVDAFRWPLRFRVQFIEVLTDLSRIVPVSSF